MTGPPTVPGLTLIPGPLSLEESDLLTELTRPDKKITYIIYHVLLGYSGLTTELLVEVYSSIILQI